VTALDSRFLQYTNCFGHRFVSPGLVRYRLSTLPTGTGLAHAADADVFTIEVAAEPAGQAAKQHGVTVRLEGRRLVADPPKLRIHPHDVVIWTAEGAGTPPYSVLGQGERLAFDSRALTAGCLFSHPFGLPGAVRWTDANGSGLGGEIVVASHEPNVDADHLQERLSSGTLVTVRGTEAQPGRIEIFVGQTVLWLFEDAPGVTVTDSRLLPAGSGAPSG